MTEVVIIEDERLIAERLKSLVTSCQEEINVTAMLQSVSQAKDWFRDNSPPDLVFLDIQLSDGNCFELLKYISNSPPVIFTTAYDEYAIKAFKYNSLDYLLKPIDKQQLINAIRKYKQFVSEFNPLLKMDFDLLDKTITQSFKKRFLIKLGDQFQNFGVSEISYFQYDQGTTYLISKNGKKLPIDYSLDQLGELLNPVDFLRINRQFFVHFNAIKQINTYFNSRLLLTLQPPASKEVVVSRDRVSEFKRWMDC